MVHKKSCNNLGLRFFPLIVLDHKIKYTRQMSSLIKVLWGLGLRAFIDILKWKKKIPECGVTIICKKKISINCFHQTHNLECNVISNVWICIQNLSLTWEFIYSLYLAAGNKGILSVVRTLWIGLDWPGHWEQRQERRLRCKGEFCSCWRSRIKWILFFKYCKKCGGRLGICL